MVPLLNFKRQKCNNSEVWLLTFEASVFSYSAIFTSLCESIVLLVKASLRLLRPYEIRTSLEIRRINVETGNEEQDSNNDFIEGRSQLNEIGQPPDNF
ncbi:uncharacterized protein OCT59_017044 [Rhizophagus irregularis]|uniref:uncharacterized protein n=1 Tax=Rhizophagus irregularis TaxID=588596 RepID=UPI00331AB33A|nr:hypothetical protein OCT59_017044 [Rhizophagus irregularis]